MILSQEDAPQTHKTVRQISRETGVARSAVHEIIHKDIGLKCLKKGRAHSLTEANQQLRLSRSTKLLRMYPYHKTGFIWFTDEKVFTVASPRNTQNDRVYIRSDVKKRDISAQRLLRVRPTFSKSLMVSVGISKLGNTSLIFIDPGVKINAKYYRDVLLGEYLLPQIRAISGEYYIFQQDGAPAHRARETVQYLISETPEFITPGLWPPNSPDLNPLDYKIWGIMQERVYRTAVNDVDELKKRLLDVWASFDQRIIDQSINEWSKRLHLCIRARGGHFEHLM